MDGQRRWGPSLASWYEPTGAPSSNEPMTSWPPLEQRGARHQGHCGPVMGLVVCVLGNEAGDGQVHAYVVSQLVSDSELKEGEVGHRGGRGSPDQRPASAVMSDEPGPAAAKGP